MHVFNPAIGKEKQFASIIDLHMTKQTGSVFLNVMFQNQKKKNESIRKKKTLICFFSSIDQFLWEKKGKRFS